MIRISRFWDRIQNIVKYMDDVYMKMILNLYEQDVFFICSSLCDSILRHNYLKHNPVLEVFGFRMPTIIILFSDIFLIIYEFTCKSYNQTNMIYMSGYFITSIIIRDFCFKLEHNRIHLVGYINASNDSNIMFTYTDDRIMNICVGF